MYTLLAIIILISCFLCMLIVLIQNPKGGGIAANFSNIPTQMMGVKQTTDVVERLTWTFGLGIFALCIIINFTKPSMGPAQQDTKLREKIDNMALPQQAPAGPQAPAAQPAAPAGK